MGSRAYPRRELSTVARLGPGPGPRSALFAALVALVALALCAGCATTSSGAGRGSGGPSRRGIAARILLFDGTPVAGHALSLRCDGHARTVRTDDGGRLTVPDASSCQLIVPWLGRKRSFTLKRETLYGTSGEMRLPPVHRVVLRFFRGRTAAGTVVVDERIPGVGTIVDGALEIAGMRFEMSKVKKGAKLAAGAALIGVREAPAWPNATVFKGRGKAQSTLAKAAAQFAALRTLTRGAVPKTAETIRKARRATLASADRAVTLYKAAARQSKDPALSVDAGARAAMVHAETAWWAWRVLSMLPEGRDEEPTPLANRLARLWTSRLTLATAAYREARAEASAQMAKQLVDPTIKVRRMVPRSYRVVAVNKLSWLPLAMREDPSPTAAAAAAVRVVEPRREGVSFARKKKAKLVKRPPRVVRLRKLLGKRTILAVGPCKERARMVRMLDAMELERARNMGLSTHALFVDNCAVSGPAPRGGSRLVAGAEMLWALGIDAKKLEVPLLLAFDERGRVTYRSALSTLSLKEGLAALAKGWAVLAAALSGAGNAARAQALLSRAAKARAGGKLDEARRLVEKAISADNKSAEAHRLRARVAAELGDLSTASEDVSWWRQSFGDLSADELEDELKKLRKKRRRR